MLVVIITGPTITDSSVDTSHIIVGYPIGAFLGVHMILPWYAKKPCHVQLCRALPLTCPTYDIYIYMGVHACM